MYLIAYIFESRVPGRDIPIWKWQSKAYLPGDFGLAMFTATSIYLWPRTSSLIWARSCWWIAGSILAGMLAFWFARKFLYRPSDYSKGAWNSPTKIWHDVAMFFGYFATTVYFAIPSLFFTIWDSNKLIAFFALAVWIVGNIWDFTHDEVPNIFQHPDVYQPIWITWKQRKQRKTNSK